jgi:hypothetical protein
VFTPAFAAFIKESGRYPLRNHPLLNPVFGAIRSASEAERATFALKWLLFSRGFGHLWSVFGTLYWLRYGTRGIVWHTLGLVTF